MSNVRLFPTPVKGILYFSPHVPGKALRTRRKPFLAAAYGGCDNGWMDGDLPATSDNPFGGTIAPNRCRFRAHPLRT